MPNRNTLFAQIPTQIIRRSRDTDDNAKPLHCFYCVSVESSPHVYVCTKLDAPQSQAAAAVCASGKSLTLQHPLAPEPLAVEREYIRHRRRADGGVVCH